jgi:hypothetical protein
MCQNSFKIFQNIFKNLGITPQLQKYAQTILKNFSKIWSLCPNFQNMPKEILEKIFKNVGLIPQFLIKF